MASPITWQLVDTTGAELGATEAARGKWRQRGVPSKWRIAVAQELLKQGVPVSLGDFDQLPLTPGRIAA